MAIQITFSYSSLPANYCWPGPVQFWADIQALIAASIANFSGINYGSAVPAPVDQNKPWYRLNGDGSPDGMYVFSGVWQRPHALAPGSKMRLIWMGVESDLWAEDGGDGTDPAAFPPTDTTGAMWVRDTTFGSDDGVHCFRVPIGAGKNPTTYDGNPAKVIAVGDLVGVERVQLTKDELPTDRLFVANPDTVNEGGVTLLDGTNRMVRWAHTGSSPAYEYQLGGSPTEATIGQTSPMGSGLSHANLSPGVGVIFAKRSSRRMYTIT